MESFLAKSKEQLDLIPAQEVEDELQPAYQSMEGSHTFTAERLFDQNPRLYKAIVKMVGSGLGQRYIAELLQVHPATIRAVEARERDAVDTLKKRTAGKALTVSRMCIEEMEHRLDDPVKREKIPFKDLAVGAGILVTKSMELNGAVVPTLSSEDFRAGAEAFKGFLQVMGSVAETAGQKGDPVAQAKPAKPVIDLAGDGAPDNDTHAYGAETTENT